MPKKADCGIVCHICGQPIYPLVGHQQMPEDACVVLKGQWMWSPDLGAAIFVLDQDTELVVFDTQGNGQLAILPDDEGKPTRHVHEDCYERTAEDSMFEFELEETGS
jgi:hypothetical protein